MAEISVIVPVYNTEQYINRCINSILSQTFADFELILVDDGSTDASGKICDDYTLKDYRVKVFHQENRGQAAARNFALDWVFTNSGSKYISFVDSDDWVHPRFLELLYEGIIKHKVNICQCGYLEADSSDNIMEIGDTVSCITSEEQYTKHYSAMMWDKLFSKSCWNEMRFPEGQIYEDVAIWYKILFKEKELALNESKLYYYFINPDSTVRKDWTPAKLAQVNAWENQLAFANDHGSKVVLQSVLQRFCWVFKQQCDDIKNSTKISEKERDKYYSKLIRRLRTVVFQYRKLINEMGVLFQYASWTIPGLDKIYWTYKGIWGKIKKLFK